MKTLPYFLLSLTLPLALFGKIETQVYGYVKLDAQYNSSDTGSTPSPAAVQVPLDNNKGLEHGELILDARESRIGVNLTETFKEIKLLGVVEGDFFTVTGDALNSNGRGFRLRHAYARAEWPSEVFMIAGQTWSTFMNSVIATANTVDFSGPVGAASAREPQFRVGYTKTLKKGKRYLVFQAAVEKQATDNIPNLATEIDTAQGEGQRYPLFVAKLTSHLKGFMGEVALAGSEDRYTDIDGRTKNKKVWGVQASLQIKHKRLGLYAHGQRLDGLNRLDGGNLPNVTATLTGVTLNTISIKRLKSWGWYAGGSWNFTKHLMMNAVYGWELADRDSIVEDALPTFLYKFTSIHANILYEFYDKWQTGIEYERLTVHSFGGENGQVNIAHFALWFFF